LISVIENNRWTRWLSLPDRDSQACSFAEKNQLESFCGYWSAEPMFRVKLHEAGSVLTPARDGNQAAGPGGAATWAKAVSRVLGAAVFDLLARLIRVVGACQDLPAMRSAELAVAATRDRTERECCEAMLRLQQAILPTSLRRCFLGRYDVSVRYWSAHSDSGVGGDWYDARLGPDGSAVVAIGDVAGHGLCAAAGMARIGNALRGLSVTGQPASTLLDWLNRLVCSDESPERVASVAVCMLDQGRPALRGAQAGHPPPVLVSCGTTRLLARPSGLLLGAVPNAEYHLAYEELAAGDILFFYTDGLIERRDRDIDEGIIALLTAAEGRWGETADEAVEALLDRLDPPTTEDDVCVLAVRVRP
jgi:serine phosphatase RsbU (regulator of sigma subunit)